MEIAQIAKICRETNRAYCQCLGDDSHPVWEEAPEWQIVSAIAGVQAAINNPYATPEDQHNSWVGARIREGWVFGEEKDEEAKTHPYLMPYEDLPEEQRIKNALFLAVVRVFHPVERLELPEPSEPIPRGRAEAGPNTQK